MNDMEKSFWDCRPRRALDWRQDSDGRVVILRPKFGSNRWGAKFASWIGTGEYRIRLDDIGTLVWKSLDGQTPLSEVLRNLRENYGSKIEPAEMRLQRFVDQMHQARLIEI